MTGRVLTLEQIRKAGACANGRSIFRKTWGNRAVVNQQWAREAEAVFESRDATWAAMSLLPPGWQWDCYSLAREDYTESPDATWNRVSWAIFAALYVEAGKP